MRFGRFRFLLIFVFAAHAFGAELAVAAPATPRGGRVGWARLITPDGGWRLHSGQDSQLARFIRDHTTLNIDPVWYSVNPESLERLSTHPFIYAKTLSPVRDSHALANIREYLQRGGFILVDQCTARRQVSEAFSENHRELFTRLFPDCVVRELPDTHDLFRCYFTVTVDDLFPPELIRHRAVKPVNIGMLGVFLQGRMIAVINARGLECGWPQGPQRVPGCMSMIVNAYVYAMTR